MKPIRYPNITGSNDTQRLRQMEKYLRYMAEQLNYLLMKREVT